MNRWAMRWQWHAGVLHPENTFLPSPDHLFVFSGRLCSGAGGAGREEQSASLAVARGVFVVFRWEVSGGDRWSGASRREHALLNQTDEAAVGVSWCPASESPRHVKGGGHEVNACSRTGAVRLGREWSRSGAGGQKLRCGNLQAETIGRWRVVRVKNGGMERRTVQSTQHRAEVLGRPTWDLELENVENRRRRRGAELAVHLAGFASPCLFPRRNGNGLALAGLLHCATSQGQGFRVRSGGVQGWAGANGSLTPEHPSPTSPFIAASGNPCGKRPRSRIQP